MRTPIATQSASGRSKPLTIERLVNMYAEAAPSGAKSPVVAHGCPGLTRFADIDTRRTRGLYRTPADGRLYTVVRNTLYYVDPDGDTTALGSIDGAGRVGMSDNGLQLCIVTGASGYTYSTTEGLQQITDPGFPGADTVTFLDGYFIFNNSTPGQRGQFFISNLLDGQMYDAADFATAESYPDNLLRVFADHSQLLLFGTETIEIWFNAGIADFPFTRAQGSVIEQGLGARWSVAKVDETVIWLDNEGMVRRLDGNTPVRISTHAIEYDISRGDWENATAWSYVEEGHQFYVLTVPAADLATQTAGTYVFDAATQLWHDRKSYRKDYSRSGFYARAYGKHITADIDRGRLYEQSLDVYEEDGEHLIAEMQFPQIQNDGKRFIVHRLQLDMEVGVGGNFLGTKEYIYGDGAFSLVGTPGGPTSNRLAASATGENSVVAIYSGNNSITSFAWNGGVWAQDGLWSNVSTNTGIPGIVALNETTAIMGDGVFNLLRVFVRSGALWNQVYSLGVSPSTIDSIRLARLTDSLFAYYDEENNELRTYEWDGSSINQLGNPFTVGNNGVNAFSMTGLTESTIAFYGVVSGSSGRNIIRLSWDGLDWSVSSNPLSPGVDSGASAICAMSEDVVVLARTNPRVVNAIRLAGESWEFFGAPYTYGSPANDNPTLSRISGSQVAFTRGAGIETLEYSGAAEIVAGASNYSPEVMLDISGNTRTWDMTQNWRSMGKKGEYDKRVIWRRLGQHRSFTPRIAISAPVKRAVFACYVDIKPQNS